MQTEYQVSRCRFGSGVQDRSLSFNQGNSHGWGPDGTYGAIVVRVALVYSVHAMALPTAFSSLYTMLVRVAMGPSEPHPDSKDSSLSGLRTMKPVPAALHSTGERQTVAISETDAFQQLHLQPSMSLNHLLPASRDSSLRTRYHRLHHQSGTSSELLVDGLAGVRPCEDSECIH